MTRKTTNGEFNPARVRLAAGALYSDQDDRVLLVKPGYKDGWEIPGGYVEPGESPRQACLREINEELQLVAELGDLLVVDWAPQPPDGDKMLFIFDAGMLTADDQRTLQLDSTELTEYDFFPVDELSVVLPSRLARRLTAATEARQNQCTLYLEHGIRT
jgi:ADP-ribose pyrophosphatase YjhB (NUDIX family)